ncbi:MAG: YebC/PmpR family DNA-binding transcriptional regulator [Clostridia bacterium]|nr:YebC/PmpR family DNA-binding transcriptional regulator [Clostridia bacterium]
MSGHSKWNNIKHKKEKTDAQKAKVFTKIGKEIAVAVKEGGPEPTSNSKLRDLIIKAKANNVPNDNIDRIIKKAAGGDGANYDEIVYEGYGIGGVAVIVETLTDNRNRTSADVRHYFDKYGGNMGTSGCVSFMFDNKGVIVIEAEDVDEDKLFEDVLECGADDLSNEGEVFEVYTDPAQVGAVAEALEKMGYKYLSAEAEKVPQNYVELTDEEQLTKFRKMLDVMEENEDIQNVWHNCENAD